jgi:Holliday junction resolvase
MRESNLQSKCIKYTKTKGILTIDIHGGGWTAKGAPDLICCINGMFVAFELKVDENDMQSDQRMWKKRIEKSGGKHYCPRTLKEFIEIVEVLK